MKSRFTILIAVALLLACGDDAPAPAAARKRPKAKVALKAAPAAATAIASAPANFRYDVDGKRDPFRSFVRGLYGDEEAITSPLERFDLSQLELTAIVWGTEAPQALIRDPAGKGYVVTEGAIVGKNKGRIVAIEDNLVLVKETYVDHLDRATTKAVELRLRDEPQGG